MFAKDIYLSYLLFFAEREISFEISPFGGLLFLGLLLLSGFAKTCDILLLLLRGCYFLNFTVLELV